MDSDLISRTKLKEAIRNLPGWNGDDSYYSGVNDVSRLIDEASPVRIESASKISKLYIYEPSIENYRKITAAELSQLAVTLWPKGRWILTDSIIQNYAKCSICGEICEITKFCGNCGALMQPEGESDEKEDSNEHTNLLP